MNKLGQRALLQAAADGNTGMLKVLLEKGASIEAKNNAGQNALMEAVHGGNLALAEFILNQMQAIDENAINIPDRFGDTMLMHAARGKNPAILNMLLANGASLEAENNNGQNALMMAVISSNMALAELLLEKTQAIDPNAIDKQDVAGLTLLMHAVSANDFAMLEMLLAHDPNIALKNNRGHDALVMAMYSRDVKLAERLLELMCEIDPATIDKQDAQGHTLLMHAVLFKNSLVLEMLLDKGASIWTTNNAGHNALVMALDSGNVKLAGSLIEKGQEIDPDAIDTPDAQGDTLLMHAARIKNPDMLKMLIDKGANIKARNRKGEDGFTIAAKEWRLAMKGGQFEQGAINSSFLSALELIKLPRDRRFKFNYRLSRLSDRFLEEDNFAWKVLGSETSKTAVFDMAKLVADYLETNADGLLRDKEEIVRNVNDKQASIRGKYPALKNDFKDFSDLLMFLRKMESNPSDFHHVQLLAVLWFIIHHAKKGGAKIGEIDVIYYQIIVKTKDFNSKKCQYARNHRNSAMQGTIETKASLSPPSSLSTHSPIL